MILHPLALMPTNTHRKNIIRPPEGDRSAGFYIKFDKFDKIQFWDFLICGKWILGHFEHLEFSTKDWIFKFSINFSYVELYLDRTIHICSYVEPYMDCTIHICSYVDVAGGRRAVAADQGSS